MCLYILLTYTLNFNWAKQGYFMSFACHLTCNLKRILTNWSLTHLQCLMLRKCPEWSIEAHPKLVQLKPCCTDVEKELSCMYNLTSWDLDAWWCLQAACESSWYSPCPRSLRGHRTSKRPNFLALPSAPREQHMCNAVRVLRPNHGIPRNPWVPSLNMLVDIFGNGQTNPNAKAGNNPPQIRNFNGSVFLHRVKVFTGIWTGGRSALTFNSHTHTLDKKKRQWRVY